MYEGFARDLSTTRPTHVANPYTVHRTLYTKRGAIAPLFLSLNSKLYTLNCFFFEKTCVCHYFFVILHAFCAQLMK